MTFYHQRRRVSPVKGFASLVLSCLEHRAVLFCWRFHCAAMAQYGCVQMGLHGSPCCFWITFDDGLQNGLMLFDRERHGMRKKQNLRHAALQLSADEGDEVEDQIIVGCPG